MVDTPVTFVQPFRIDDIDGFEIVGRISFQGCDDQQCLPPSVKDFTLSGSGAAGHSNAAGEAVNGGAMTFDPASNPLWQPVGDSKESISDSPWWYIFLWGFIGGLDRVAHSVRLANDPAHGKLLP